MAIFVSSFATVDLLWTGHPNLFKRKSGTREFLIVNSSTFQELRGFYCFS